MKFRVTKTLVSIASLALLSCALGAPGALADGSRRVKQQVQPTYPDLAKQMHIAGAVKLEITITPQGAVRTVKILGGHPLLADSAERAVKNWKYEAGEEETRTIVVEFKQ